MDLQQAIKIRIIKLCNSKNITINKLSTLSGINQSTANSLVDGSSKNPKLLTIIRICFGLNMSLKDFFDDPIFDEIDDE